MDRQSVTSRFQLLALGQHPRLEIPPRPCPQPGAQRVAGTTAWRSDREFVFTHAILEPDTEYQAVLLAGYEGANSSGGALCHYWTFQTEPAPVLTSSTPTDGDHNVDPTTYFSLSFSRPMDMRSLASAITLSPSVPYAIRAQTGDPTTVVIGPQTLLNPGASFTIKVSRDARDRDGNRLGRPFTASFTTGAVRPLHGWVTFIAAQPGANAGSGVWVVDPTAFPRQVANGPVSAFSWSADGTHLLVSDPQGHWSDSVFGSAPIKLPFRATWAAALSGGGYVYLEGDALAELFPTGRTMTIATGVGEATVDAGAQRVAFTVLSPDGTTEIRGYDPSLHTQYVVSREAGVVRGVSWSRDGSKLAYRLLSVFQGQDQQRVKDLGSGAVTTVATGELGPPAWEPDSLHLVFTAAVAAAGATVTRIFVVNIATPLGQLTPGAGIPNADLEPQQPVVSPDGRQIAFVATQSAHNEIWSMNSDGSGLSRLTSYDATLFPYSVRAPAWTPS